MSRIHTVRNHTVSCMWATGRMLYALGVPHTQHTYCAARMSRSQSAQITWTQPTGKEANQAARLHNPPPPPHGCHLFKQLMQDNPFLRHIMYVCFNRRAYENA
jgi:hypothetical protein